MSDLNPSDVFGSQVRHFAQILNDLFDPKPFMRQDRLFELVCALVRSGGMEDSGWDPWYESQAVIDDILNISRLDLTPEEFPNPERTRVRLALLSYCHVTEMDLPYFLLANLLRLRLGQKYDFEPFADLARFLRRKASRAQKLIPPSPGQKIKRITELAQSANLPKIGEALTGIYDNIIRNAVYHSDYVLHEGKMHLLKDYRLSKKKGYRVPAVEFDELDELITNAFAFYSALFSLYERCLRSFTNFKNAFIPYDLHYKGLLELLFDGDNRVIGFRVYWPNGSYSEYSRTKNGCTGLNLEFNPDRSINFMVGMYASKRGSFSPLVEHDAQPVYAARHGSSIRPYWPEPPKVYKLPGEPPTGADV